MQKKAGAEVPAFKKNSMALETGHIFLNAEFSHILMALSSKFQIYWLCIEGTRGVVC
jgi:hypothetical protein